MPTYAELTESYNQHQTHMTRVFNALNHTELVPVLMTPDIAMGIVADNTRHQLLTDIGERLIDDYGIRCSSHIHNGVADEIQQVIGACFLQLGVEVVSRISAMHNHRGSITITMRDCEDIDVGWLRDQFNRVCDALRSVPTIAKIEVYGAR